jgi:predicted nucleic acid-binding protein
VALFYTDSSALVKLVRTENHSPALRAFIGTADLVSSESALTEVTRALRRGVPRGRLLDRLITNAGLLLDEIGLVPLDRAILLAAGAFAEPNLRTLDAVHVATALDAATIDAFVTYDGRQAAVARLAGLRVVAPSS